MLEEIVEAISSSISSQLGLPKQRLVNLCVGTSTSLAVAHFGVGPIDEELCLFIDFLEHRFRDPRSVFCIRTSFGITKIWVHILLT